MNQNNTPEKVHAMAKRLYPRIKPDIKKDGGILTARMSLRGRLLCVITLEDHRITVNYAPEFVPYLAHSAEESQNV